MNYGVTVRRVEGDARRFAFTLEAESITAAAKVLHAAPDLAAACKAALSLAWETGTETEDGVHTLLEDSRGDLWRQLSAALTKAGLL